MDPTSLSLFASCRGARPPFDRPIFFATHAGRFATHLPYTLAAVSHDTQHQRRDGRQIALSASAEPPSARALGQGNRTATRPVAASGPRSGRPPLPAAERRTVVLMVRATPAEARELRTLAARRRQTVAATMRDAGLQAAAAEQIPETSAVEAVRLRRQVQRIGSNLNQAVRRLHVLDGDNAAAVAAVERAADAVGRFLAEALR